MSSTLIGIDIRHDSVHIAAIDTRISGKSVTACATAPLDPQGEFTPALTSALASFAEQFNFTDSNCAITLPPNWAFYRNLLLPIGKKEKIRQILPFELESTLATSVDDLQFDFHKSPHATPSGQHAIVAVAVLNEDLEVLKTALEDAGITANSITIGAWPLAHLLAQKCPPNQTCLLLDADPPFWTLYLLAPNEIKWVRGFRLPEDPNKLRKQIVQEVQATWTACQTQETASSVKPDRLYVNGLDPNLLDEIIALTPNDVCSVTPVKSHQLLNSDPYPANWQPEMMNNALALGLSHHQGAPLIEFGTRGFKFGHFLEKYRSQLIQLAVLTGIVLFLAVGNLLIENHFLKRQLRALDQQIETQFKSTFPDVKRVVAPHRQMASKVTELKKEMGQRRSSDRSVRVIDILHTISAAIPSPLIVRISSTAIGPEMMTLDGTAQTFKTVNQVKARLGDIPWVRTATISAAKMNRSGKEVRFKLRLTFNPTVS